MNNFLKKEQNKTKGESMKDKLKIILITIITAFCFYKIINWIMLPLYAASSKSQSDEQLIARAINGEARGESYEGQVAVRCCDFKQSKKR